MAKLDIERRLVAILMVSATLTTSTMTVLAQSAIYENPIVPAMTAELRLGKLKYDAFCAECHGETARGTDKGPTFISRVYHPGHHGDRAFFIAPMQGAKAHHWPFGDMKPVEGVAEAQLAPILKYVRAVQKANGVF